jgi:hypothetical protein
LRLKKFSVCHDNDYLQKDLYPLPFSSRSFTEKVLRGDVPYGETPQSLLDGLAYNVAIRAYRGLFSDGNDGGRWTVTGCTEAEGKC